MEEVFFFCSIEFDDDGGDIGGVKNKRRVLSVGFVYYLLHIYIFFFQPISCAELAVTDVHLGAHVR